MGSGALRLQIGTLRFGVGVGSGLIVGIMSGRGVNLGGGKGVGSGAGGTRGSGKPGSGAAAMTSVRFQSGPYGAALALGDAGVTVTGAMLCNRFSVTWPMTRSPARSPIAMAATKTTMPSDITIVANRFDGSCTIILCVLQRLRRYVASRSPCFTVGGFAQHVKLAQFTRSQPNAFGEAAKFHGNLANLIL